MKAKCGRDRGKVRELFSFLNCGAWRQRERSP
jgi:hypothetical protein